MSVKAIDRHTVHRICSGQVVLSLAVAVKELVENGLDAGATSIEVRLKEHGSELVEISDNGCGVAEENFEALTLKHHTSKIRDFSDLEVGVNTFGFRGEALSSLCALSDLAVTTCHQSQTVGTKLEYDSQGHITSKAHCARQVGTTVSLRNLFHSLPVRRKEFIRNIKKEYSDKNAKTTCDAIETYSGVLKALVTEFGKMVQLLQGYCLVSTGVKITCYNQAGKGSKQLVLSTTGNPTLKDNITDVFGSKQFTQLVEIVQCSQEDLSSEDSISALSTSNSVDLFKLSGYISRCNHGYGRGATDRQFFFFNNRPCDHMKLTKLVNEVYHIYNRHQYPFVVLNISTAKEDVDVNVTPDKRKVMLHQERVLLLLLRVSLRKLFEPMQGQYDTQHVPATPSPSLSADSSFSTPAANKSTKLGSLKRLYSYTGEEGSSEPQIKQAKLFDYVTVRSVEDRDRQNDSFSEVEQPLPSGKPHPLQPSGNGNTSSQQDNVRCDEETDTMSICKPGSHTVQLIPSSKSQTSTVVSVLCPSGDIEYTEVSCGGDNQCTDYNQSCVYSHHDEIAVKTSAAYVSEGTALSSSNFTPECLRSLPNIDDPTNKKKDNPLIATTDKGLSRIEGRVRNVDSSITGTPGTVSEYRDAVERVSPSQSVPINLVEHEQVTRSELQGRGGAGHVEIDQPECRSSVPTLSVTFDLSAIARRLEALKEGLDSSCRGEGKRFRTKISPTSNTDAEKELRREISKSDFSKMEILGQFNLGFIITKLGNDLFIVDQHATDEKYNFERLQREMTIKHQILLSPIPLELTAVHESVVMDNLEVFKVNGFHFHIDHSAAPTKRVKLASKPVCGSNWSMGPKDIDELVFMLSDSGVSPGEVVRPSAVRAFFASKACRTSVMIGTALSKFEMRKLVCHMGDIEQPWNCPHGRPTMRHIVDLSKI